MDLNPFRIFLSGSTADFGRARQDLRDGLARGRCEVIHEDDFPQTQADTVLKLAQLIEPCGIVVHLVGRAPGSTPAPEAVAEYLAVADQGGGFLAGHPQLRASLGDFSGLTYTQWEMLIALHLGRLVLAYADGTHEDPGHPQRAHLERLVTSRRFFSPFDDPADLYLKVMGDVMAHYRQNIPAADLPEAFRPSNLPGGYIGRVFMGREVFLDELRKALLQQGLTAGGSATAITQAQTQGSAATGISGLGGIGKTHAAVEYAHRHRAHYSALLFVSGDSPEKLNSGLASLCKVLGLEGQGSHLPREESAQVEAAVRWLAVHPGWLLIVDNVDDEPAARALMGLLNRLTTGHILVTSRLREWADNVRSLDIEVLETGAAAELLLALTEKGRRRTAEDANHARALAEVLDGLPLALHQAAGYINEQRLTLAAYLTVYETEAAELLGWFSDLRIPYERPDKLAPRPVLVTWKTSFDKLDEETRRWLLVFSHFAPEPIPEFLLEAGTDAAADVKARNRAGLQALAQAEKYCLLSRDAELPRFKVHRLVQQIVRLSADEEARGKALGMGIQLIRDSDCGDPTDVRNWGKWNAAQPHAVVLCGHAPNGLASERLGWLLGELAVLLNTKCLYAQAEPIFRRTLAIAEASFGGDHPNVATRLNNLAGLLQNTNRLAEAESLMLRALAIDEVSLPGDHPNVAARLNNLAQLLMDTNRLTEAEPLMARVVVILEKSMGEYHPHVATALNNLAGLLKNTNRFTEAEPLMRRALAIDQSRFGSNHPNVAIRLNNLAQLFKATHRLGEAEPLMRRALSIDQTSFGSDHPNVAIRLNNLARLLQDTHRLTEAEPLMRRAFSIFVASLGLKHPNSQGVGGNYVGLLRAMEFGEEEIQGRVQRIIAGDEQGWGCRDTLGEAIAR